MSNEPASQEAVTKIADSVGKIRKQLARVIVGQDEVIDELLMAIFSRGHVILEGVPGLAKTLLISTLSRSMKMSFHRIQFTPDLMPSDITGTEVIQEDKAIRPARASSSSRGRSSRTSCSRTRSTVRRRRRRRRCSRPCRSAR